MVKAKEKITKAKAEQAKKTLDKFNRDLNKKFIHDFTCICCRKNKITPTLNYGLDAGAIDPLKQQTGMWDNGAIELVSPGYGSSFDTDSFFIGICDPCIKDLHDKKLVVNYRELRNAIKPHRLD